ncbi:hypothetical protein FQZ97_976280 [compost metagenome]
MRPRAPATRLHAWLAAHATGPGPCADGGPRRQDVSIRKRWPASRRPRPSVRPPPAGVTKAGPTSSDCARAAQGQRLHFMLLDEVRTACTGRRARSQSVDLVLSSRRHESALPPAFPAGNEPRAKCSARAHYRLAGPASLPGKPCDTTVCARLARALPISGTRHRSSPQCRRNVRRHQRQSFGEPSLCQPSAQP